MAAKREWKLRAIEAQNDAMVARREERATRKKVAKHNIHQLIKDNIAAIGHFHTGGYPGRKDLDDTQLLDWPALMRTIAEAGYTGYVAHEFIPKAKDPKGKLAALEHAVKLCDV